MRSVGANYMADLILVDYDEKITDTPTILTLIKKAGYDAITLATPF